MQHVDRVRKLALERAGVAEGARVAAGDVLVDFDLATVARRARSPVSVMAIANGLTSAILDPLDKELMDAMITAELILNKAIYCDSFLEAYRKK